MTKVAYNVCYGGFSLSRKAVLYGREISGDQSWGGFTLPSEKYDDGSGSLDEFYADFNHLKYDHPRHDPVLVKVIEDLGTEANGKFAALDIIEIEGDRYRIDEYDGAESVETPESYDWVIVEDI